MPDPVPPPGATGPVEPVAAARRRRIPFWATPVLAALPLWAYLFQGTLTPPPVPDDDPMSLGGQVYASQCAHCHGARGDGAGAGPALGEVLVHWPDHRDMAMWVRVGAAGWPSDTYGATGLPKGVGMPGHRSMSDADLARVVLYERVAHGGLDVASDEALELIAIAEGELTFADAGLGDLSTEVGLSESDLAAG